MAGGRNRLTATAVEKRKGRGRLADGSGLWLNISHTDSKSWVFRWTPNGGKPREMGLGSYPTISLSKAREKAEVCRRQVADGLDPKIERDRQSGKTFGEAADAFFKAMQSTWSNEKSRHQWQRTLTNTAQAIRERPIADIETADILKVLQPIWQATPETASRTRMRLERVLDYAKARHWRDGENPARWKGHLQNILPARQKHTRKHHAAMRYQDVPAFIERISGNPGNSSRAMELLILTACRSGEVLKARWEELDIEAALWVIPPERMKARVEHRVPLVPRAIEILTGLRKDRHSEFVFPGQKHKKPLSDMTLEMLMRRMKITDATPHGFRSSFRDWAGDETSFPREVAEGCLAHKVGSAVERPYRRGDALEKRRRLLEAWADYCTSNPANNVVKLAHG